MKVRALKLVFFANALRQPGTVLTVPDDFRLGQSYERVGEDAKSEAPPKQEVDLGPDTLSQMMRQTAKGPLDRLKTK